MTEAVDRADAQLTAALSDRERERIQTLLKAITSAGGPPHELPAGLAKLTGQLLSLAHLRVRELTNEALKAAGLVTPLYGTLTTLDASGPASQQAIAERLGLSGTAILKTVDRLEADGLVKRRRDPTDRRAYALELTPAGHATLQRARAAITEINGHLDTILGGGPTNTSCNAYSTNCSTATLMKPPPRRSPSHRHSQRQASSKPVPST